ncbi:unnamed protein product [Urochloa decumbens]|uniref:Uncharacterized protein n=1 Tax=Urochloa decumbens TaxID=240449 RepID=A0ABC9GRZ8_9POAL
MRSCNLELVGGGGHFELLVLRGAAVEVVLVVGAEELAHVLQRPAAGLREEGAEEHPGERGDAGVEEEGAADGDGVGQRDEGHGDDAAGHAVGGHAERAPQRAHLQREDLRAVHPRDGAQPNGEEGHVGHGGRDGQADGPRDLRARVVVDHGESRGEAGQREDHPAHAAQQQRPPPDLVQQERGHQDEERLGDAHGARGSQELVVGGDPRALEHARAVEHHGVDAGRLLEEVDAEAGEEDAPHGRGRRQDQLLPHPRLLAILPPGHLDHVAVEIRGDAGGGLDVGEPLRGLLRRVGGLPQHDLGVGQAALHDEPPGRLGHAEHHEREHHGRRRSDAEHDAPAELERQAGEGVVGDVAEEDAEVDEHLREGGEEAAGRRGGHLGRVHGRDHERVPHADAGHEAPEHEHPVVDCEPHEEGAREEDDRREDDGVAAADPVGRATRGEGADEGVDVEDAHQDLQLDVGDLQVLLDVQRRPAHHTDICKAKFSGMSPCKKAKASQNKKGLRTSVLLLLYYMETKRR